MKIVLCSNKEKLLKALPRQYQDQGDLVSESAAPYTLVTLTNSVAKSRVIEKAIANRHPESTLVVAVRNMSQEAVEALVSVSGVPITTSDYYWTDERYQKIKEFGGVREKPREKNS